MAIESINFSAGHVTKALSFSNMFKSRALAGLLMLVSSGFHLAASLMHSYKLKPATAEAVTKVRLWLAASRTPRSEARGAPHQGGVNMG